MIKRKQAEKLGQAAQKYPVLTLTGPRQSGKTTLARYVFSDYEYVSLEDPDNSQLANDDPRGFLDLHQDNVIIDEAQRAPEFKAGNTGSWYVLMTTAGSSCWLSSSAMT